MLVPHHGHRAPLAAPLLAMVLLACEKVGTAPSSVDDVRVSSSWVTADVAQLLNSEGHFELPAPEPASATPEIDEATARLQAEAWMAQFGRFNESFLEATHGGAIDIASLTACGAVYATTPYEEPPADAPMPLRRLVGPVWLVSLCSPGGIPQVSIAVSAYNTDVKLENGRLVLPQYAGREFVPVGIPAARGEIPMSPERAVEIAYRATQSRVARVPELQLLGRPAAPALARWRVTLEQPRALVAAQSGATVTTRDTWVGYAGPRGEVEIAVEAAPQPDGDSLTYYPSEPIRGVDQPERVMYVRRRAGYPLRVQAVRVDGGL